MSARILVVEDDVSLGTLIRYNLDAEGYPVEVITRGDEVETIIDEYRPDLIVMDWMLPGVSGLELCRRIRARKETAHLPLLMLTAKGEESDLLRGFETGVDDYIVKPFSIPELLGRIKAILRRSAPSRMADELEVGDIRLDRAGHRVSRNGRDIRMGPTEYRLLEFFMQSPGRVFTRSQLLDGVWGRDVYVDERTVDVHIGRLRRALIRGKEKDPIRTVRGAGYAFGDNS
ncbi:MAG: phosphate regulon transcriptional regulatory protein PhoB [Rhizobiales bacterium]|nr:phosphate regulon transcriptional regulatory protein PhoB [Hyphomicrobiales bacterium]